MSGTVPDKQPAKRRVRRALAWSASIAVHVMVFAAILWPRAATPPTPRPPILVDLTQQPQPEQPPGPPGPPGPPAPQATAQPQPAPVPTPAHQVAHVHSATPAHLSETAKQLADDEDTTAAPDNSDLLSASDLAAAAAVGEGGGSGGANGGGGCDMARAVQQALRKDPLVRSAVMDANRQGKAVMLWNGDWVRTGGQDGKGLSAVREAITWEIAFAPAACRNQPIHGLVLLSLADGATRFAVGAGAWRWSDLLGVTRQ